MEEKRGREFGFGTLLGDSGEKFVEKSLKNQVLEMGWSHACPIIDEVAKEHGSEWTLKRYAECNFVFGLVTEAARDINPDLYKLLTTPVPRLENELPWRRFKPNLIPKSFYKEMSPLSTPWGYAIPRVIIEEMGRGKNNSDRTPKRILKALSLIDKAVKSSETPIELLVNLSESVSRFDADPKVVLSHTLAAGVLQEGGCMTVFNEIKQRINKHAPILRKAYNEMSAEEKLKGGILVFNF